MNRFAVSGIRLLLLVVVLLAALGVAFAAGATRQNRTAPEARISPTALAELDAQVERALGVRPAARSSATDPAAQAATPTLKQLASQVATLQRQVKALQKKENDTRAAALGAAVIGFCNLAITADGLQGTWAIIDQIATATQQRTYFGTQTPVDDSGVCAALKVLRSNALPPTTANFATLLSLLKG